MNAEDAENPSWKILCALCVKGHVTARDSKERQFHFKPFN